jgi:hypothetical protein
MTHGEDNMKDWQKVREEFDHGDIHVSLGALCEKIVQLRVEIERLEEVSAVSQSGIDVKIGRAYCRAYDIAEKETARKCAEIARTEQISHGGHSKTVHRIISEVEREFGLEEL